MISTFCFAHYRYSPHNFKKNNASAEASEEKQQLSVSVAQISIPIIGVETKLELKSTKTARTSIKNWESLWNFPVYWWCNIQKLHSYSLFDSFKMINKKWN